MAEFADIAHPYQADANIAAYARAGYDRMLFKASQGTGYVNPLFGSWWRLASTLGMARGAYHYALPSRWSGAAEAAHFARTLHAVGGLGARDWVELDAEETVSESDRRPVPGAAAHAAESCHRMAELGYPRGVLYTGAPYATAAGLVPEMLPEGWRWLHIANYNRTPDDRVPLPRGWDPAQVVARQYTSAARQAGIPRGSDASRVVHEWLPDPEEDEVTPEDHEAIADRVLAKLADLIFQVQPPIRQARNAGAVIGATYNKIGDAQSALAALAEQVGLVGIGVHAARQEMAIMGGKVDALTTATGATSATFELEPFETPLIPDLADLVDAGGMLRALLVHLGIKWPPPPDPARTAMAAGDGGTDIAETETEPEALDVP